MKYLVTTFKIIPNSEIARDLLASIAAEAGFETFEESDEGMKGYVQESLFAADVLDECIKDFPLPDVTISYTVSPAEDKDWNETWEQAGFEPIVIDNRCIIYDAKQAENGTIKMANEKLTDAPHEKGETLQTSETSSPLSIAIDARMAFGTGTHDTTQMIVRQLLDMHVEGKRVLDCGCGTGILGIVAAKLGAERVVAYDIDEWSVENTRHNDSLNGVDFIEVLQGDAHVLSHVSGVFDIVLANINRNILLQDMPAFKDIMAPEAVLIISGFYEEDIPLLVDKASSLSLEYHGKDSSGDWRCLVFR